MAELKNCRRCNRVFSFNAGVPICPECLEEGERNFKKVSLYIRDNPGVPLAKVSTELDIPYEMLMKYVREGRLQIRTPSGKFVSFCEKCGAMVNEGKLCKDCTAHINNVLDTSKRGLQKTLADIEKSRSDYKFLAQEKKK